MPKTFDIANLVFIDFETRSATPIQAGTDRYARDAQAILLAWAVGDGPVQVEEVRTIRSRLKWSDMPYELNNAVYRVQQGTAWLVAHNAAFDRAIWNFATDFPPLGPYDFIDTRAQAAASGLPAKLADAAKWTGGSRKLDTGSDLIKLFSAPDSGAAISTRPKEWKDFVEYARADVEAMRDLFKRTLQLRWEEWEEYWANEVINDRGIGIDLPVVEEAALLAAIDQRNAGVELYELTDGAVDTVNKVQALVRWMTPWLPSDGQKILVDVEEERDPATGDLVRPRKWTLTRDRIVRLLAYLDSLGALSEPLQAVQRALQIRLYGGSKTPAKFARMLGSHVGGVIRNQYVFNGATQTGRFSSKGVQIHNLQARESLPYEMDALDALANKVDYESFRHLGDDTPVSRKLSLLVRPTLVAQPGKVFVWADWSNIEARLLPWLAASKGGDERLEIFREVDRDKSIPDIYKRTAATLLGKQPEDVTTAERQQGKVVELAAGFGGSTGAMLAMAAAYHMHMTDTEAKAAVDRWRKANPWASDFWGKYDNFEGGASFGLWGAINEVLESRGGDEVTCGRVRYGFLPEYLGGSLVCELPSGRVLVYRRCRWEMVDDLDDDGEPTGKQHREMMFRRDMAKVKLWPGLAAENVVQATAADLLRDTLVRLGNGSADWMPVRLHTHDEILVEVDEARAGEAARELVTEMEHAPVWADGLPIKAEATVGRWYSKQPKSWGL